MNGVGAGSGAGPSAERHSWTREEDNWLELLVKANGGRWAKMAPLMTERFQHLGYEYTGKSLRERYINQIKAPSSEELTDAQKERIVTLRMAKIKIPDIATELGTTVQKVSNYWYPYAKRNNIAIKKFKKKTDADESDPAEKPKKKRKRKEEDSDVEDSVRGAPSPTLPEPPKKKAKVDKPEAPKSVPLPPPLPPPAIRVVSPAPKRPSPLPYGGKAPRKRFLRSPEPERDPSPAPQVNLFEHTNQEIWKAMFIRLGSFSWETCQKVTRIFNAWDQAQRSQFRAKFVVTKVDEIWKYCLSIHPEAATTYKPEPLQRTYSDEGAGAGAGSGSGSGSGFGYGSYATYAGGHVLPGVPHNPADMVDEDDTSGASDSSPTQAAKRMSDEDEDALEEQQEEHRKMFAEHTSLFDYCPELLEKHLARADEGDHGDDEEMPPAVADD